MSDESALKMPSGYGSTSSRLMIDWSALLAIITRFAYSSPIFVSARVCVHMTSRLLTIPWQDNVRDGGFSPSC